MARMASPLRSLPSVARVLEDSVLAGSVDRWGRETAVEAIRRELASLRARWRRGELTEEALATEAAALPRRVRSALESRSAPAYPAVVNATGVLLHTNLGRAPLGRNRPSPQASYLALEYDLETGRRGQRLDPIRLRLAEITGAGSAVMVNNNAGAVLLLLAAHAAGREVIVSRGQLVEIGGSFRIPDVMARSGATLVEVGATNRTHPRDYEQAIGEQTALLLKVHTSNFRVIGFTAEVGVDELCAIGRRHGLPVMEDLGSGCLVDLSRFGLPREPTVGEVVAGGVDIVTFSGDKLLGGPQAGIILGRGEIIERIKKNPLNRALRIDKFTLAGLESVLRLYYDEHEALTAIPTLAMLSVPRETIARRARRLAAILRPALEDCCAVDIVSTTSRVGGGALPEYGLPTRALRLQPRTLRLSALETGLRRLETPVIGRLEDDAMLFDMRTVDNSQVRPLAAAVIEVLTQGGGS